MSKKDLVKFDTLAVGAVFTNPRNGWVYKKLPDNYRTKAGRAEFIKTDLYSEHLVGKSCVYAKISLVKPQS